MNKLGQDTFVSKSDSKVKIKVITSKCISAATCIIHAPNTFDLDEGDIAFVKETTWDEALDIFKAAKSCPTKAIIIEDMDGKQLWPVVNV